MATGTSTRKFSKKDIEKYEKMVNTPAPAVNTNKPKPILPGGTSEPSPFAPTPTPYSKPIDTGVNKPTIETYGGISQADLDKLQSQGVDVFKPGVLKKLSALDVTAQANMTAGEAAVGEAERALTPEQQAAQLEKKQGILGNIGQSISDIEGRTAIGAITGGTNVPNELRGGAALAVAGVATAVALAPLLAGITAKSAVLRGTGLKILGAFGLGRLTNMPEKMISDSQAVVDSSKSTADTIIESVKLGTQLGGMSAQEATSLFAQLQRDLNNAAVAMRNMGTIDVRTRLNGGLEMEAKIRDAQIEFAQKQVLLINAIRQNAAGTGTEIASMRAQLGLI